MRVEKLRHIVNAWVCNTHELTDICYRFDSFHHDLNLHCHDCLHIHHMSNSTNTLPYCNRSKTTRSNGFRVVGRDCKSNNNGKRERKMWNEWIENKRKKWKPAPIKCLHIPCNEKWLFRMTGSNCAVLLRIMSEMNRQKDGHGNEMKWRLFRPANPMHANEIAFVCQITQFCINCFSSDEAHKFTHKYFAVERIFAVEMQLMPLKLYWYVWFTPLSAHMSVSTAQICAYLAFHQFEHYVSQCVCVCVCASSPCLHLMGFASRYGDGGGGIRHMCDKQTHNHPYPLNTAYNLLIKLICILAQARVLKYLLYRNFSYISYQFDMVAYAAFAIHPINLLLGLFHLRRKP